VGDPNLDTAKYRPPLVFAQHRPAGAPPRSQRYLLLFTSLTRLRHSRRVRRATGHGHINAGVSARSCRRTPSPCHMPEAESCSWLRRRSRRHSPPPPASSPFLRRFARFTRGSHSPSLPADADVIWCSVSSLVPTNLVLCLQTR
jgi:hypothetical protein